jgi:hypothetical protein
MGKEFAWNNVQHIGGKFHPSTLELTPKLLNASLESTMHVVDII